MHACLTPLRRRASQNYTFSRRAGPPSPAGSQSPFSVLNAITHGTQEPLASWHQTLGQAGAGSQVCDRCQSHYVAATAEALAGHSEPSARTQELAASAFLGSRSTAAVAQETGVEHDAAAKAHFVGLGASPAPGAHSDAAQPSLGAANDQHATPQLTRSSPSATAAAAARGGEREREQGTRQQPAEPACRPEQTGAAERQHQGTADTQTQHPADTEIPVGLVASLVPLWAAWEEAVPASGLAPCAPLKLSLIFWGLLGQALTRHPPPQVQPMQLAMPCVW